MSNYPKRSSHDAIRQAERVRYQELTEIGAEFGCAGLVPGWVEDGTDPDEARASRAQFRADAERRRVESEIRQVAPVTGRPAVRLLVHAFFGRPDVPVEVPANQRAQFSGAGRDALAAVAGIAGLGASPDVAWSGVLAGRGGAGVNTQSTGGIVKLGMGGGAAGAAGASTASSLPAAVEDSLREILTADWQRSGSWWMAATRLIRTTDFRDRIWRVAMSGASVSEVASESASPVQDADVGSSGWLAAQLQVKRLRSDVSLSYERWVSGGGLELGQWLQGRLTLWHDEIDAQVAALLGGAAVRTVAGTYDDDHWDKAVTALNRQTIGGAVLGASRPIAVVGENRRGVALSLAPRAEGDRGATLERVEVSASVPADFAAVVHPRMPPCAISHLHDTLVPIAAMGPAVKGEGGARSDLGAVVMQDRSAPALITDADDQAVGVVRLTV